MATDKDTAVTRFFADKAWVGGAWASDVLLSVGEDGRWCGVQTNAPLDVRQHAVTISGPVLPGLVNAHSHAFQRAIAGLTECRNAGSSPGAEPAGDDDFWSWRDRMYSAANRITPAQLEAIATLLYAELLMGGYTQVCEFHYLHNAPDGNPYADPLEMALALVRAARTVGIGLTLLPTLYMRSGFGATGLRADQQRFASSPDSVMRVVEGVMRLSPQLEISGQGGIRSSAAHGKLLNAGIAVHSLRAVDARALDEISRAANQQSLPVHIHVAEQTQEVSDCLDHTGERPVEWLLNHAAINARWNLVHATHTTAAERQGIKSSGAAIVICPSTEANLGDGVFDFSGYAGLGGTWSIGSDSHITRNWPEELRLLEYSQRLTLRKRNIAASVMGAGSTAAALFEAALAGGNTATAQPLGGIAVGNRADFCVLDAQSTALLGVPDAQLLDALVFSSPAAQFSDVFVAGQPVINAGQFCGAGQNAPQWPQWVASYAQVMKQLWH
jgi:formimidoylglutamate deiminase